jgi:ATP-dependent Lhr-like helicase
MSMATATDIHRVASDAPSSGLEAFHPALAAWFEAALGAPTEAQRRGWSSSRRGENTLILAPTGSGKTLAAFLAGIDQLLRLGAAGELRDETHIVYVSPLKALSNDIHKNLAQPLAGVRAELEARGEPCPEIRTAVRPRATPARAGAAMGRRPPPRLGNKPESVLKLVK